MFCKCIETTFVHPFEILFSFGHLPKQEKMAGFGEKKPKHQASSTATFVGALQSVALCQASYSLATQVFRTSDYSTASGESTNDL